MLGNKFDAQRFLTGPFPVTITPPFVLLYLNYTTLGFGPWELGF
jgi:hypothetical protein